MNWFNVVHQDGAIRVRIDDEGYATLIIENITDDEVVVRAINQANSAGAARSRSKEHDVNDVFQGLTHIAPKLDQLAEDASATASFEMMSGGLVWSDELPPWNQMEPAECHCLRAIWRFRSSLILGCPEEKYRPYWEEAQRLFPNWPGFNPRRSDRQWRQFLADSSEKSIRQWEQLDQRFREKQRTEEQRQEQPAN